MLVQKFKTIIKNDFTILSLNKSIVVINKNTSSSYINKNEIIYKCNEVDFFENKYILNILSNKKNIKCDKLIEFIKLRTNPIIGTEIITYSNKDDYQHFCDKLEFTSIYNIEKPVKLKLNVVETFDNIPDFLDSSLEENGFLYGMWNIETNEINTAFVWDNKIKTQIAFHNCGERLLSIGSLFVKLKIII